MLSKTVGYARTANNLQDVEAQIEALNAAGCVEIFKDTEASGSDLDRPGLQDALGCLQPGDTLMVVNIARLTRSPADFAKICDDLGRRKITLASLDDPVRRDPDLQALIAAAIATAAPYASLEEENPPS